MKTGSTISATTFAEYLTISGMDSNGQIFEINPLECTYSNSSSFMGNQIYEGENIIVVTHRSGVSTTFTIIGEGSGEIIVPDEWLDDDWGRG